MSVCTCPKWTVSILRGVHKETVGVGVNFQKCHILSLYLTSPLVAEMFFGHSTMPKTNITYIWAVIIKFQLVVYP